MVNLTRRRVGKLIVGTALLASTRRLSAQGGTLDDDVAVLRAAMDIHPGALRYLNPAELDAGLDDLGARLADAATLSGRYLALSRFLSTLRCGHTYANFYNQAKAVRTQLFDRPTRLPFTFRWIDGRMVVTDPAPGVKLPRGSVVTTVNGVPTSEMLTSLLPYTRADGTAADKRRALLEVQHRGKYEYFDVFHGLVYGEPDGGRHRLEYVDPEGRRRSLNTAPISLAQRQTHRAAQQEQRDDEEALWTFDVRDGIGVLTMPDWSTYKTDWNWRAWLDARLDEVADLRGLIIDNRENEGGTEDVGTHLMSRLVEEPIALPEYARLVRFRSLPASLRAHATTWDRSLFDIGQNAKPVGRGFYRLSEGGSAPPSIEPRGRRIATPAVLLTSPTNSSATFTFAQYGQASRRLTLIGRPTGGNRRGINGDGYFFITLPHSGIEFDVPIVGKFPLTPQPNTGVTPDIRVAASAADIAEGRDRVMEQALAFFG